jgi:hypothetical protein
MDFLLLDFLRLRHHHHRHPMDNWALPLLLLLMLPHR